jgi:hypothetical protein
VRYFATASGPRVRDAMRAGRLGQIVTPAAGNRVMLGVDWCADNSVFANRYPGDDTYLAWLDHRSWAARRCAFAVAPDVVGDAAATLRRSAPMLPRIRAAGYPAALAAQNGLEHLRVPWDEFDAMFLGGDTAWKLGQHARRLTTEAKARGKWVHMGRVNSRRRLQIAAHMGCDSADGTYLAKAPDKNLPRLLDWLAELSDQLALFDPAESAPPLPPTHRPPGAFAAAGPHGAAIATPRLPLWTPSVGPSPSPPPQPRPRR